MNKNDVIMRGFLYLMLSKDGKLLSQEVRFCVTKADLFLTEFIMQVLLEALNSAVDEEEERAVVVYLAFTEHPHPQMIAELERRIGHDPHSTDPLLLAYGALVTKASPDLQQRMTLFLLNRLPLAETNASSLIHHILSLGNTESHVTASSLVDYLSHPDQHVQLSSLHALRYVTGNAIVQKALKTLVSLSNPTEDHLTAILNSLLFGLEHAASTYTDKPFDPELTHALTSSVMASDNTELTQMLISYLQLIDNEDSRNLLNLIMTSVHEDDFANSTRTRRGTYWAENNAVYNLISPLSTRQHDWRVYGYRKSFIWGKKFGVDKANVQIAAGGFMGVARDGGYKVYARAKAVGYAFGKTKTALDFLVQRQKTSSYTLTRLYAEIAGKTLVNFYDRAKSSVCKEYSRPLYSSRKYKLFDFGISIFIYVGTLRFHLAGYVKLNTKLYVKFCENKGSLTAEAGLVATVTLELQAGATANLLVRDTHNPYSIHVYCTFSFFIACCSRWPKCQCCVQLQSESETVNRSVPYKL